MTPASSKCPDCGKPASGNFCQHCGAGLGGRFCEQCGAATSQSAAFCNQCGAKLAAVGRAPTAGGGAAAASVLGGQNLPWWIAGVAMFVVIVVVGVNMVQPAGPTGAAAPAPIQAPAGGGTPPDLSTMTEREAADRLFDRVMRAVSAGDSAGAQAFLPMALDAYDLARPLDHDGLFHLSLLNRTASNPEAALANAEEVLDEDPDHVLALSAAAQAAVDLGRVADAEVFYGRLLEVFDEQRARALPEYEAHSGLMESVRDEAEAFLAGR